jgi:hypothetical protein
VSIKPTFDVPFFSLGDIPGTLRKVVDCLANVMRGNLNATLDITLAAGAATTVVKDPRIGPFSALTFMPQTANAAAEIGAGTLYVSARLNGQATLAHANAASTDRTYTMLIVG